MAVGNHENDSALSIFFKALEIYGDRHPSECSRGTRPAIVGGRTVSCVLPFHQASGRLILPQASGLGRKTSPQRSGFLPHGFHRCPAPVGQPCSEVLIAAGRLSPAEPWMLSTPLISGLSHDWHWALHWEPQATGEGTHGRLLPSSLGLCHRENGRQLGFK